MKNASLFSRVAGAALMCSALALAGCDDTPSSVPMVDASKAKLRLELSSRSVEDGGRVAVALRADVKAARAVGAIQGRVHFDPARLKYVGQAVDGNSFVLVNDTRAGAGELRVVGTDLEGFGIRPFTLVFEVMGGDYDAGLRYSHEELALTNADLVTDVNVASFAPTKADLAVPADARALSVDDWAVLLARDNGGKKLDISLKPGEYRLNLVFGDANLSGAVSASDALILAQVAAGLREVIIGSDAPSIDVVVAGNVAPFNLPGLGEPGDASPPGLNPDGSRTITSSDVLVIRQEAAGLNPSVAGDLIPGRGPLPTARVTVPGGDITVNTTWTKNNIYELSGVVRFTGGAVLTIEAGTRVEGLAGAGVSALFIARDAQIQAAGTPLEPIVFTCTAATKFKGCWGGVFIAGNASVNEQDPTLPSSPAVPGRSAAGCNQRVGEATNPQMFFGGCNDADNSGVLQYAIVEYGGFALSANVELNNLTLAGVGNGTTIDHIQAHAGLDDGFEMFGGTVNLKHLVATGNSDDSFDISFGYNGNAQFVIMQHDPNDSDKGIEADNTETAATYGNTPRTSPELWNFTFIGLSDPLNPPAAGNTSNDALHVRRGTGPSMSNFLIYNARLGSDLDDAATCSAINASGASHGPGIRNSIFANALNLGNNDTDPNPCGPYASATEMEEAWINDVANANQVLSSSAILKSPVDFLLPDFRPLLGQAGGGGTPPSNGFFDVTATYVGAVAPSNSTTSNAPWYSGWTRGWQSSTTP